MGPFQSGRARRRGGKRLRHHSGRLHPWLLAAAEQLGQWSDFFQQAGYAPMTPDWPDDPETVEQARANPDVLANKTLKQVADHTAGVIGRLENKPAVMGTRPVDCSPRCSRAVGSRRPRLPSTRACFAASCRCLCPRSGRLGLSR
jgi:hypothetical protein